MTRVALVCRRFAAIKYLAVTDVMPIMAVSVTCLGVKDIPCRWLLRLLPLAWATKRDDRTDDGRNALQALGFALVLSRKKSSAWQ